VRIIQALRAVLNNHQQVQISEVSTQTLGISVLDWKFHFRIACR